jgi:hypothetical protein
MRQINKFLSSFLVSLCIIVFMGPNQLPAYGDQSPAITVFMPNHVRVYLRNGNLLSGRFLEFDPHAKMIVLGRDLREKKIAMEEMSHIIFYGEVRVQRRIVIIRGGGPPNTLVQGRNCWKEPIRNFRIVDLNIGKAQILLSSTCDGVALAQSVLRGIEGVAKNNQYVLEKIRFNPEDTINIEVKAR